MSGWLRITGFSGDSRLAQGIKVFCRLRSSGRVMHGKIGPFNSAIFTETALVMDAWQTGNMARKGTRTIARTFYGAV